MDNPLRLYLATKPIGEVAKHTGISHQTLRNLKRLSPEEVGKIELHTAVVLKDRIGVDLIKYHTSL